jgi:hypothetical protein
MFKNLTDILTADCEVIQLKNDQFVYPIFKNGRSSLMRYARKNKLNILKNKEISNCKKITIFLRSPKDRFASGVHTFLHLTGATLNRDTLEKIENFNIINRHFVPQYLWLFHLHKYFNGIVNLRSIDELYHLIPNRDGPWTGNTKQWKAMTKQEKQKILSIQHKRYVDVDKKIIKKYINRSVALKKITQEFKLNALP